jgi:hypothetical protein
MKVRIDLALSRSRLRGTRRHRVAVASRRAQRSSRRISSSILLAGALALVLASRAPAGVGSLEATTLGSLIEQADAVIVATKQRAAPPTQPGNRALVGGLQLETTRRLRVQQILLGHVPHVVDLSLGAAGPKRLPDDVGQRLLEDQGPFLLFLKKAPAGYRTLGASRGLVRLATPEGTEILRWVGEACEARKATPRHAPSVRDLGHWLPRVAEDAALDLAAATPPGENVGQALLECLAFPERFERPEVLLALSGRCRSRAVSDAIIETVATAPWLRSSSLPLCADGVDVEDLARALVAPRQRARLSRLLLLAEAVAVRPDIGQPEVSRLQRAAKRHLRHPAPQVRQAALLVLSTQGVAKLARLQESEALMTKAARARPAWARARLRAEILSAAD